MTNKDKPIDVELIACEVCLKELPKNEALVPEATDYVIYFCGLACHEKWQKQHEKSGSQAKKSVP